MAADGAAAAPGLTFIPHYDGEQFVADLIDLAGRVVHQWRAKFAVFGENPAHVQFAADDPSSPGTARISTRTAACC